MVFIEDVNYTRIQVLNEDNIRPNIGETVVNSNDMTRAYKVINIIRADKIYIICQLIGRNSMNYWEMVRGK